MCVCVCFADVLEGGKVVVEEEVAGLVGVGEGGT